MLRSSLVQELVLPQTLRAIDLVQGADPYVFQDPISKKFVLVLQGEINQELHRGARSITLRVAAALEGLNTAEGVRITVAGEVGSDVKQVWAPEIHYIDGNYYLYVAMSDGDNVNHRMFVYKAESLFGPYVFGGLVRNCTQSWAIDLTYIPELQCFVWSGWRNQDDQFPQRIYIAKAQNPTTLAGERVEIASPIQGLCTEADLLEGAQALVVDGALLGLTVAVDASWKVAYKTHVIWYRGGDPLQPDNWRLDTQPLFPSGYGIGHGIVISTKANELVYVAHQKSVLTDGWDDRVVTMVHLSKEMLFERRRLVLGPTAKSQSSGYHQSITKP